MSGRPLSSATAEQVWESLRTLVTPLPAERVATPQSFGRVLAEDALCTLDFPPFDRAVMDGYAVRSADFSKLPVQLRRVAAVRAGAHSDRSLESGACIQINTGAAVPIGADAVIMVERSQPLQPDRIQFDEAPAPGQHIERRGKIARAAEAIVRAAQRIGAGELAALQAAGIHECRCHRTPRVAFLSTGDEIVEPGAVPQPGQIFDSNQALIRELVSASGGSGAALGRCPDDPQLLKSALARGLDADLLCVTGGMSKGTHDLVPSTLEALGVTWLVTSLDLKPGKPTRIGRGSAGNWVVGLPGNPVSCAVCFALFVTPILSGLQGMPVGPPPMPTARLESAQPANGARPMFQPARWTIAGDGTSWVAPIAWRGSGDPFALAGANALAYRPRNAPPADVGDSVRVVPLNLPIARRESQSA